MNSHHSDVDKSRISIAESNLTSESSSSSLSSSPMTSPRNKNDDVINGGERTRDVTPKEPSPVQSVPIPAQGNIKNSAKGNSGRLSRQKETTAQSPAKKGNTPYGHIMTKNGYIMVGKLTNRSRHASKASSARPEKVDPITARILSANRNKRNIAGNQAGEIKRKNMQLYEEIKSLRILCRNQEKSLKQFESTQSALPRVLQNFEHDKALLKERLRKTKDGEKRLEREKKRLDIENEKNQKKIKELNNIIQNKNLDERWSLQQQLSSVTNRAEEAEGRLGELNRKMDLQQAALERQLKKEIRRRVKAENQNQKHKDDIRLIQEKLTEKEKQLNYTNIYIQRQNKGKRQNRNTSLALPGPALDSSTVSAPAIAHNQPLKVDTLDSIDLGAGEGNVVSVKQEIELTEKPSSTFLTDLVDTQPVEVADLNDFSVVPERVPVVSSRAEPRPPSAVSDQPVTSSPTPKPIDSPLSAKAKTPEVTKTADALLDEMLFGGEKKTPEPVKETPKSPNLFDLGDNQPAREDSVPEFDFGSETTKKTSKDTILAELADLHGGNSPENEKPAKKEFNIFDEPRSKPKIDPLEAPMSKDDELDALLKLNTTKTKKSNPVVYNFSEPIENLHLGLSSSGKDFSRTTTTTNNTAKKDNNLIDNLFGGGN